MNTKLGMALTGFAAAFALLALTPAGASFHPYEDNGPAGYAMAEVVHRDADGELVASHDVHNRLINRGEARLIQGTFGTPLTTNQMPTILCISDVTHNSIPDIESAATGRFTPSRQFAPSGVNTCIVADIDTTTAGIAVMNATFTGGTNLEINHTIDSVQVCDTSNPNTVLLTCGGAGSAFASVEIPPTTLDTGDTVNLAYTFDLRSPRY